MDVQPVSLIFSKWIVTGVSEYVLVVVNCCYTTRKKKAEIQFIEVDFYI